MLMVAGQETSAILLAWTCAFLARYPRAARRAAAEVDAVLGTRPPASADCARLPFTEACVLESMRLKPPAYMVGRCAHHRPVSLGGFDHPQGTTFLVSPYLIQRDPAHWRQARAFQPQRWRTTRSRDGSGRRLLPLRRRSPQLHRDRFR